MATDGNILPLPAMAIKVFSLSEERGEVAVVEVSPSDLPPVRYKGIVWIRTGPRKAMANETQERQLSERRTALARTFDSTACRDSTISDLVLDLFVVTYRSQAISQSVIDENHRDIKEQLASLRFYDLKHDAPTYAGILLFGSNPLYFLYGAKIQFLRIDGESLSDDILQDKLFSGDLIIVLRELRSFVEMHILSRPFADGAMHDKIVSDYPSIAINELLRNAIVHRDYQATAPVRFYWFSDRIEIQNPGGLYGEATKENFPRQNAYRNPVIAESMKNLGYVNNYGRGVISAQEALRKNENPPAEFEFDSSYVLATIRKKR